MVDGHISQRRVLVPLPTHHEATVRMARVLASEGVLAGLYVPMNTHRLDTPLAASPAPTAARGASSAAGTMASRRTARRSSPRC